MSHRAIDQESLGIGSASRSGATLDQLLSQIDCPADTVLLSPLFPSAKGELAWPPLTMFVALLRAVCHNLSDVKLAEALEDRASIRRFCGLAAQETSRDAQGLERS